MWVVREATEHVSTCFLQASRTDVGSLMCCCVCAATQLSVHVLSVHCSVYKGVHVHVHVLSVHVHVHCSVYKGVSSCCLYGLYEGIACGYLTLHGLHTRGCLCVTDYIIR